MQGAPGTGKTAVGLHRAAYLLYLHRERLRRSGVLIVGPNTAFLSYISAVLPALGEVEVQQSTVDDLIARAPVRGTDSEAAALLKHDPRMAAVLAKALWARLAKPTEPIMVSDGSYRWRIDAEPLRRIVDEARREGLPYAVGRERVRARVVGLLQRQSEYRTGNSPGEGWLRKMSKVAPVTGVPGRRLAGRHPGVAGGGPADRSVGGRRAAHRRGAGRAALGEAAADRRRRPGSAPPTWCCSTRRPGCSSGRPASGTWWWTRRRTCRRCRRGRSPGAASTARSRCSATWRRAPRRGPPRTGGTLSATWASRTPRWCR